MMSKEFVYIPLVRSIWWVFCFSEWLIVGRCGRSSLPWGRKFVRESFFGFVNETLRRFRSLLLLIDEEEFVVVVVVDGIILHCSMRKIHWEFYLHADWNLEENWKSLNGIEESFLLFLLGLERIIKTLVVLQNSYWSIAFTNENSPLSICGDSYGNTSKIWRCEKEIRMPNEKKQIASCWYLTGHMYSIEINWLACTYGWIVFPLDEEDDKLKKILLMEVFFDVWLSGCFFSLIWFDEDMGMSLSCFSFQIS